MSDDFEWAVTRELRNLSRRIERGKGRDIPAIYLPWTQRSLNPFPLASSGGVWGDQAQPWSVRLLTWYVTVFVPTNDASNYWTLDLVDTASAVLATVVTSGISPGTYTRLSTTSFTQPSLTNARVGIRATATLSPGQIYILPALALLRT